MVLCHLSKGSRDILQAASQSVPQQQPRTPVIIGRNDIIFENIVAVRQIASKAPLAADAHRHAPLLTPPSTPDAAPAEAMESRPLCSPPPTRLDEIPGTDKHLSRLRQALHSEPRVKVRPASPSSISSPSSSPSPSRLRACDAKWGPSFPAADFGLPTTSRAIQVWERRVFGREPITNKAPPPLRLCGSPAVPIGTAALPSSSKYLSRVRALGSEMHPPSQPEYYTPHPALDDAIAIEDLKKIAPALATMMIEHGLQREADGDTELHLGSGHEGGSRSPSRRVHQMPTRSSGFHCPVGHFHGIRQRPRSSTMYSPRPRTPTPVDGRPGSASARAERRHAAHRSRQPGTVARTLFTGPSE